MKESGTSTSEIIQDMLSADSHKIWSASCAICSLSQNGDRVAELLPYRQKIENAVKGISLGGALAPNSRFLKKAFEILDFYEKKDGCPCCLLGESFSPIDLVEDGYFTLLHTTYLDNSNYIDYYTVRCNKCGTIYKVEEREYHFTWWNWVALR